MLVHRLDLAVGAHVDRGGQRAVGQHDALRPHEPLLREARGAGGGRVVGGWQCEDAVEQRGPRGQCEQHDRREDRRRRGAASPPPRRQPHPRAVTAAQGQAEEVEAAQAVALAARGGTRSSALLGRCFRGVRRRRSARVHAGVPQLGLRAGLGGRVSGTGDKHLTLIKTLTLTITLTLTLTLTLTPNPNRNDAELQYGRGALCIGPSLRSLEDGRSLGSCAARTRSLTWLAHHEVSRQ